MGDFNTTLEGNFGETVTAAGFISARNVAHTQEGPAITHVKGKDFECDHIIIKPQSTLYSN